MNIASHMWICDDPIMLDRQILSHIDIATVWLAIEMPTEQEEYFRILMVLSWCMGLIALASFLR